MEESKMKTNVNKLQEEQALTNKIMFVSIIVLGTLLFIVSGKNFWSSFNSPESNNFGYFNSNTLKANLFANANASNYSSNEFLHITEMKSLGAKVASPESAFLEIMRLNEKMQQTRNAAYYAALNTFPDVEEPEILLSAVLSKIDEQEAKFDALTTNHYPLFENDALQVMYEDKKNMVFMEIENEVLAETFRAEAEENKMEDWMLESENFISAKNFSVVSSLKSQLKMKNEAIAEAIEYEQQLKELLVIAKEQPLKLEKWMTDGACWCPEKKSKNHLYHETYAFKSN
jgi:hypothetical protein